MPDVSVDLQAASRLEGGHLEAFLARVGDGTELSVGGSHSHRSCGSLLRLDNCVVPGWDVLEVGEEREHVLDCSPDRHCVLEGCHDPSSISCWQAAACRQIVDRQDEQIGASVRNQDCP